ncbi:MAG: mannose-1-phosphate guanylyltransferase [Coprobacter sp.]|nr:mannose-1-phosphate guanylyltransferase [Coprobacter sp.]
MTGANYVVIMAGGVGSRFWPMSTAECPKQFIDVLGCGRTLLQMTFDRFAGIVPAENIWVVTSKNYKGIVKSQLPDVTDSHILAEPCMRNTAPCIAYVSWKIKKLDAAANIVFSPSDHLVTDVPEFRRVISRSLDFSARLHAIVTLGMKVFRPETGYGYIAVLPDEEEIKPVEAFKEKPNKELAEKYMQSGNYYWNAGVFVWNVQTIEKSFRTYCPDIASVFDRLDAVLGTDSEQEAVDRLFPECPSISVDYAIMEKAPDIYVFPADFGWSDLGTWGSLHRQLASAADENVCIGVQPTLVDSTGCIVHMPAGKKVVIEGLHNYIVAEKDNTLLICRIEDEQQIKDFSK